MAPTDLIGCVYCHEPADTYSIDEHCTVPEIYHWIDPKSGDDPTPIHHFGTLCPSCVAVHWAWKEPMGREAD